MHRTRRPPSAGSPHSVFFFVGACVLFAAPLHAAPRLPTGFTDEVIASGLSAPTSFAFLPDGRVLVTEQTTGRIRLVVNGVVRSTALTTVSSLTTGSERGLLSIAVDPGWPTRPYVYVHHTQTGDVMRVLRFTATGSLTNGSSTDLTLGSAYTVIGGLADAAYNHNGGALRFGNDGMLYLSLGDDATGCMAQDSTRLRGCILRMKVSGLPSGAGGPPARSALVPTDNPFVSSSNTDARLVWAYGLRNPFRMQVDPGSSELLVADVGQEDWEELSLVGAGDNGGWPFREGPTVITWYGCTEPGGQGRGSYLQPIDAYDHGEGVVIIAAGVYRSAVHSESWPAAWDGNVFYADFYSGFMRMLSREGNGWVRESAPGQPDASHWALDLEQPVDFLWGPDGHLWWLSMSEGTIHRIVADRVVGLEPPLAPVHLSLTAAPNPAPREVVLAWDLPRAGRVRLSVYDLSGRRVALLVDSERAAGTGSVGWNGVGEGGRALPGGVYLAQLELGGERVTRRIVFTR
jgi:glucose/arabinose dehydrogenase